MLVELDFIIDRLLTSCKCEGDMVVFWRGKASLSYPFDPETDQLLINFRSLSDPLDELQVTQLAGLINSIGL